MAKNLVEDYKNISIFRLKKQGYLSEGTYGRSGTLIWSRRGTKIGSISILTNTTDEKPYLRVVFTQIDSYSGEKKNFDYKIYLAITDCNYGGYRYWFICPCSGIKCGVLYLQGNGNFACRKILNLAYEDQNITKKERDFNKIFPKEYEAEKLYKTIKYKYRNGKTTRKYKRFLRLIKDHIPLQILQNNLLERLGNLKEYNINFLNKLK